MKCIKLARVLFSSHDVMGHAFVKLLRTSRDVHLMLVFDSLRLIAEFLQTRTGVLAILNRASVYNW